VQKTEALQSQGAVLKAHKDKQPQTEAVSQHLPKTDLKTLDDWGVAEDDWSVDSSNDRAAQQSFSCLDDDLAVLCDWLFVAK
jgi:hypothetical protein